MFTIILTRLIKSRISNIYICGEAFKLCTRDDFTMRVLLQLGSHSLYGFDQMIAPQGVEILGIVDPLVKVRMKGKGLFNYHLIRCNTKEIAIQR
ncbi:hypothetical protein ERO13_A07G142050v2 [Gossypium hirsutum]|nr:hypothetical protein ERO13_A07G142050v2 [Gossypium hirsutum]